MAAADVARRLDSSDPLRSFRERFVIPPGPIYMDGNSLGRLPRETQTRLAELVAVEWGSDLVSAWQGWLDLPRLTGDRLAKAVLGAGPGEVIVADSVTINLFKLAEAAVAANSGRSVIVTEASGFPTDRYVLAAVADRHGWAVRYLEADPVDGPTEESLGPLLDDDVGLVALSHVDFRSAALADMAALTELIHACGALALWDVSHSAGVVPIDLGDSGADMAVGCTYKYLNGGPGAPSLVWVRPGWIEAVEPVIPGWFGHRRQFAMEHSYEPAAGISRLLTGTPPIVSLAAVATGVDLVAEAGVQAIRDKSIALTGFAIECAHDRLAGIGIEVATSRNPDRRGSHVALRHPQAWQICRALIEHDLVIPDFREPDLIRLGLAPLYTTFAEVEAAVDRIGGVVDEGLHNDQPAARMRVT